MAQLYKLHNEAIHEAEECKDRKVQGPCVCVGRGGGGGIEGNTLEQQTYRLRCIVIIGLRSRQYYTFQSSPAV